MYSHDYDNSYHPAMPVVAIQVANLEKPNESVTLLALVDSGADATFIPAKHLRNLRIKSVRKARVRGIKGESYPVEMYMVKLTIGTCEFFGVRVIGDEQGEIILGRNVLNEAVLILNGLANIVQISR